MLQELFPKEGRITLQTMQEIRAFILDPRRIKIVTSFANSLLELIEERHFFGNRNHLFQLIPLIKEGVAVALVPNTTQTRHILHNVFQEFELNPRKTILGSQEDFFLIFEQKEDHLIRRFGRFLCGICHIACWRDEVTFDRSFLIAFFRLIGHYVDPDVDTFIQFNWIENTGKNE